jgi:hypothetical protein
VLDLFAGTTAFFICFVILVEAAAFSFFVSADAAVVGVDSVFVDMAPFRDLSFMLELVASAAADNAAEFLLLLLGILAFTGVTTSFF